MPTEGSTEPRGAVVYFHGGAFQYLSRRTHAHIATRFALEGHVVFNVEYRLAPLYPSPACMEDASAALIWIAAQAECFGVDPGRLVVAGESAGANIALAMTVAQSFEQRAPWARKMFREGPRLRGCIAACGVFCVGELGWRSSTLARDPRAQKIFRSMKEQFYSPWNYSGRLVSEPTSAVEILESETRTSRSLPELFAFVGARDPVSEDTHRLVAAYRSRGVKTSAHVYPGQRHAFHAISPGAASRDVWRRQLAFAAHHLT
jgi:acetyl esterase